MNEISSLARVIRQRWLPVLVVTLIGLLAAGAFGLSKTPKYASTATLAVSAISESSAASAYQGGLAASQRAATYAGLVGRADVLPRVAAESGGRFTADQLRESVTASPQANTSLLEIRAVSTDPAEAASIAGAVAAELSALVEEMETPAGGAAPVASLSVVGTPTESSTPVGSPLWMLIALGTILGLILGVLLALVRDYTDRTLRDPEEASALTGEGVLGVLFEEDTEIEEAPGLSHTLGAGNAEALRTLRTNLGFVDVDNPPKALLVTSAVPSEGKSVTSRGLAEVLGEAGKRVILVDADLRRNEGLQAQHLVGLTSVLTGDVSLDDAIQIEDGGVDFLPSGLIPPNPSELLDSHAMAGVLAALRGRYDRIIVNAPPILPCTDPLVLAPHCDAVILLARVGTVTTDQLTRAMELLRLSQANLAGLVVNGLSPKGALGYGYGHQKYLTAAAVNAAPEMPMLEAAERV